MLIALFASSHRVAFFVTFMYISNPFPIDPESFRQAMLLHYTCNKNKVYVVLQPCNKCTHKQSSASSDFHFGDRWMAKEMSAAIILKRYWTCTGDIREPRADRTQTLKS